MSSAAPFYTQALSPLPGRCFRLVASQGKAGPIHSPEPVAWVRVLAGAETGPTTGSRPAKGGTPGLAA